MKRLKSKSTYPNYFSSSKIPKGKGICRSPMERAVFESLDADSRVISFQPEPFRIPYEFEGAALRYVPDILVELRDKSIEVIEVKAIYEVDHAKNIAKFEAAKRFCDRHGYLFRIQVCRGVTKMSSRVHTIQHKYERWEDAAADWKRLQQDADRQRRSRERWSAFPEFLRGAFFWGVLGYCLVLLFRSCH